MTGMALSLVYMIVIPTVVGVSMNELSKGKLPAVIGPWLSPVSKLCMIPVIAANAAAVSGQIRLDNPRLWGIIGVCIFFNVFGFFCGKLIAFMAKFEKAKQTTFFLATGLRNNSAAMILGISFFPAAVALPAVLGIMTQHTIAALIGRLLTGKKDSK
jgi:predicted Na+-dependent transporter